MLTSDPEPRLPQDMVSGTFPLRSHPHLSAYPVLQRELEGAYTQFAAYANLIAGGGRLAPTLWESLSHYEVERTAARILGAPHPRMLQDNLQRRITWTDVLHEGLTPTDFQRQPNGMYRCRVRGTLIEISKSSYIEILTGVTERLVQPLQTLSDEQEEYRVRLKLAAYLQDTQSTLAQCKSAQSSPTVWSKLKN